MKPKYNFVSIGSTTYFMYEPIKNTKTCTQNYGTKRKKQVISESLKIMFQLKSNFLIFPESCSIFIKLCQYCFRSHSGF